MLRRSFLKAIGAATSMVSLAFKAPVQPEPVATLEPAATPEPAAPPRDEIQFESEGWPPSAVELPVWKLLDGIPPSRSYDQHRLMRLKDDIVQHGMLVPITVLDRGNQSYAVLDGVARLGIAVSLGQSKIKCRIYNGR